VAGGGTSARDGEAAVRNGHCPQLAKIFAVKGRIEASDITWAASHGDVTSRELITKAGRLVGRTLAGAGLVYFINPAQIVIGGGVSGANDLLLAAIREQVYGHSKPAATRNLLIQRSALPGTGGVIGAATMVANELFSRDHIRTWLPVGYPDRSHFRDGAVEAVPV
jgi:predicted NBD/HSP70 family sugar kinase